jgi:rhodanese-related sulfurtransferase
MGGLITECFGREEIERYIPYPNSVLVSMRNPMSLIPSFRDGWEDILILSFDDVERYSSLATQLAGFNHAPSLEDTEKIYLFLHKYKDKNIIAHCEAGVSRSGAVREFLSRMGWQVGNPQRYIAPNNTILTDLMRCERAYGLIRNE